ncbi:hypothetical protein EIY87_12250 [Amycolatopsis eburnea]|uniref:Uncharacterized protein n=1 Tax=Amycolatopsis eburnea TaxID=2267691 RepID=A0A427TDZ3_9PSEU|nr:hypothetical protein EIY87_12250 [Amycolatopsis eburnea]
MASTLLLTIGHVKKAAELTFGNFHLSAPKRPKVAFGASDAPKAALGASDATKATLGRWGPGANGASGRRPRTARPGSPRGR